MSDQRGFGLSRAAAAHERRQPRPALALAARTADNVTVAVGNDDNLPAVMPDVTDPTDAGNGRGCGRTGSGPIAVLVGRQPRQPPRRYFENNSDRMRPRVETSVFDLMNITRGGTGHASPGGWELRAFP